jgi:hypothetical protein
MEHKFAEFWSSVHGISMIFDDTVLANVLVLKMAADFCCILNTKCACKCTYVSPHDMCGS